MNDIERYEALRGRHIRLRQAAQRVIDAAEYPSGDDEQRAYASQLRDLEPELNGCRKRAASPR